MLERALPTSTIVPLRLCTIYESEDGVRAMLERERELARREALDGARGRQEWGVKLLVDAERLAEEARSRSAEALRSRTSRRATAAAPTCCGGALERQSREAADALARRDRRARSHAQLQDWAIDAVTLPPQNPELSGHDGEMLLNGAYLVEAERVDGLRELVAELEERYRALGARIELTGPVAAVQLRPGRGATALA